MPQNRRIRLRTAQCIRDHLRSLGCPLPIPLLPEDDWNRCAELARQFQKAQSRDWHSAAATIRERYYSMVQQLVENLRERQDAFLTGERRNTVPSLRHISEELNSLEQEYELVRIEAKARTLSIVTDRIILDGIDLGPFEIRLHWERIGQRRSYETVALKPNPARGDEGVTHPHVQSDVLCEGEGRVAINRALREGRLCDFFSIVNRILNTYCSASPYVPLEQWRGVNCADCGSMTDEEEVTSCTRCGDALCLDCRTYCERCECDFCNSCIGSCRVCDAALCSNCQMNCAQCSKRCCSGCLSDVELCEECQDDQDSESDNSPEKREPPAESAHPAIPGTALEATAAPGAPL